MRILAGLTIALVVTFVVACGGDDDGEPITTASGNPSQTSSEAVPVNVSANDFFFDPTSIIVAADTALEIKVLNEGNAPHTFNIYKDEGYTEPVDGGSTGNIKKGDAASLPLTLAAGDYFYRCELHPDRMTGKISAQ